MRRSSANLLFCLSLTAVLHAPEPSSAHEAVIERAARRLYLTGKYAEATDAYQKRATDQPVAAALGLARLNASQGRYDAADRILSEAAESHPQSAELRSERAGLAFQRGDRAAAQREVEAGLKLARDSLAARWWQAELLRSSGQLDQAEAGYKWLVDYYNAHDEFSADDLHWIGLAAAEFARWRRLSGQFSFLVNELYPDVLKIEKDYWPAHYQAGMLFLEKYNQPQALREFKAALAINPNAAEVHAALAALALHDYQLDEAGRHIERALAINPRLLAAHQLRADVHLANVQTSEAIGILEGALKLNPFDEETLGRLAAAYAVADGIPDEGQAPERTAKIVEQVGGRNPHAGTFYHTLGATLDLCRRFPAAARYYRLALEAMPQLTAPRGALGLMCLRLGDEAEAKRLLDESFEVDPFNVRVANSLKVLEVLDGYAVLETPHFVLRFDRGQDELLARYASRYLEEEVYPLLVKQFGFEPREKSLFEFFSRARNSDAHTWFSARMVGLPFVSTVGACAGKVVALTSPREMRKKFNWARVLKHEFVHVLNLQQTNFNVPHWFTEALAVEVEGHPRPQEWNALLLERVPKGELFNLDTINLGFVRPASSVEWQLAYCQAQLYVQYMLKTYGDDALARMLAAYADNLDTRAALGRSFDVEQAAFEEQHLVFLRELVAELAPAENAGGRISLGEAQDRLAQAADQADRLNDLARSCEQAAAWQPHDMRWPKLLARLYLKAGDDGSLAKSLKKLAENDPDNFLVRKKLAQLALAAGDFAEVEHWARQACQADLWDFEAHRIWGQGLAGQEKYPAAVEELEVALQLEPDDADARYALASAYHANRQPDKARAALAKLLKDRPDHADARTLWEKLAP
ncbi:MAG TPA: tetratricopeptide repeat protein [Pirellulales bacterium]|jgi:tetratricopeptide (TPR) repeat protein|nr:tetratricopeptide repeat protein [Pirellulales bacterium]